jgi:hypothetical protein
MRDGDRDLYLALEALSRQQQYLHDALTVLRAINPGPLTAVDRERVDCARGNLLAAVDARNTAADHIRQANARQMVR